MLLALVDDLQTREHYYPIEIQITMSGNPFELSSLRYLLLKRLNSWVAGVVVVVVVVVVVAEVDIVDVVATATIVDSYRLILNFRSL